MIYTEKLISSLIYINDTAEDISLGTDLYNEQLELKHTVPFWHNFGYIFHGLTNGTEWRRARQ